MSRPISSPPTVSINRNALDQDALKELKAFQRGLGRNDRVVTSYSGNTTIYTKHAESAAEKFNRKLDNFEKNVKSAWSHVSDLFSVKNQGNESGATKNIKDTPTQKSPPPESSSISVKQFNSQISPIINNCTIPVFDDLTQETRKKLNNLKDTVEKLPLLESAFNLLTSGSQDRKKALKEFSAFLEFAEAQGQGKSVTHQNRDAINFANRFLKIPYDNKEMKLGFGESYLAIYNATSSLSVFGNSI
jgi:hypothetical protein